MVRGSNGMSGSPVCFSRALRGFVVLNINLVTRTGLLIRMPVQAQAYRIGGAEQYPMVVRKRYKLSSGVEREIEVPYIPGSSLKGRMRGLLELSLNTKLYSTDQKIWQHVRNLSAMGLTDFERDVNSRCVIDELFGYAAVNYKQLIDEFKKMNKGVINEDVINKANNVINKANNVFSKLAITRLLVDDFFPSVNYVEKIDAKSVVDFIEEKPENRIDRITSAADPRDIVRVKPGVEFEGRLTLLLMDNDNDYVKKYLETLTTGLKLIEETYLGGSGSRGYGRVKFTSIGVKVLKISIEDNYVPKLKSTDIDEKYESLDNLEKNLEKLSGAIVKALYS
ncbi:MAG: type III-A CRISPR-associated RAMP protein Csm3 [Ignisphaera sp.]